MQAVRMLWGRQGETDEAAVGPGAPPCGSSSSSQSAVIPAEIRPGWGVSTARMLAVGLEGEGPILCQSLAPLGVGPVLRSKC